MNINLKSPNRQYIITLLPIFIIDLALGMLLARNKIWLLAIIAIVGFAAVGAIFRKFTLLPRPMLAYGTPAPAQLSLPVDGNFELFWCEEMAKYDFLNRVVEVISPLSTKGNPFQIMMNPDIKEKYGEKFMQVAVTRELLAFQARTNMKSMFGVVLPIELLIGCVLFAAAFYDQLQLKLGGFTLNFIAPFLGVLIFAGSLFLWNKNISRQDKRLDRSLLAHFSREEVEKYICITETSYGGGKKEREFTEHYMNDRITALHNHETK